MEILTLEILGVGVWGNRVSTRS